MRNRAFGRENCSKCAPSNVPVAGTQEPMSPDAGTGRTAGMVVRHPERAQHSARGDGERSPVHSPKSDASLCNAPERRGRPVAASATSPQPASRVHCCRAAAFGLTLRECSILRCQTHQQLNMPLQIRVCDHVRPETNPQGPPSPERPGTLREHTAHAFRLLCEITCSLHSFSRLCGHTLPPCPPPRYARLMAPRDVGVACPPAQYGTMDQ